MDKSTCMLPNNQQPTSEGNRIMKRMAPLLFIVVLLTACSQGETGGTGTAAPALPEVLEVDFQVSETGNINEPVGLTAIVTQGTETVTNADQVEFEV